MLNIKIHEEEVRKLYIDELEKHLKKLDNEKLFWNTKELEQDREQVVLSCSSN